MLTHGNLKIILCLNAYAANTFEYNFNIEVDRRDINTLEASQLLDFDILLAGFPCQAFSIAGYRLGFDDKQDEKYYYTDDRCSFYDVLKENIKRFDTAETFKLPKQSNGRLYKQAGNSVVVSVIERIAREIAVAVS